jgi:hypothetical protein
MTIARGEAHKAIKTVTEIRLDSGEVNSLPAKIEYSYTELKGLGFVVIYGPTLNVMPWAPTSIKQFEMDFAATALNQKLLCETLGYTHSVVDDLKTQNDGYSGHDLSAKIQSGSPGGAELKGNILRIRAVSKQSGGTATRTMPIIKRLVCAK